MIRRNINRKLLRWENVFIFDKTWQKEYKEKLNEQ